MEGDENIARKLQAQFDEEDETAEEVIKMDEALAQKLSSSSHQLSDSDDEMPVTKKGTSGYRLTGESDTSVSNSNRKSSIMSSEDEGASVNKRKEPATKEPEMEKIKRRRSTFGRSRRSKSSFGGRRSLLAVDRTLSLHDQVQNIPSNLPATTRKSQMFDIIVRESLRRYEVQCVDDEDEDIVDELKPIILTNSESIAAAIAYQIADQHVKSLDTRREEASCSKPDAGQSEIAVKVAAYKAKTKKLEEEYRQWKSLFKQRRNNVKVSEQELHEAVSGESKIEEDDQAKYLSKAYSELLDKRPDYQKYINNTKCLRQQTSLVFQNATRVATIVNAFIEAAQHLAENCYNIAEKVTSLQNSVGILTERVRQLFVGT